MSQPVEQGTLFDLVSPASDPEMIDPFALTIHSFSFFRWPSDKSSSSSCIYFVLDTAAKVVLYIGETYSSNKRWQGRHDCKRYLDDYKNLHYKYGLETAINMSFWWDAPAPKRSRQHCELQLIAKWKPPLNKENWQYWGAPFV